MLRVILVTTLLFVLSSFSASTSAQSTNFEVTFGPWQNVDSIYRTRSVYLEVMGSVIDQCYENRTGAISDIVLSCSFIKLDDNTGWTLDEEAALTTLHHKSGMNRDGSKRYFWHEWFNID
jgi:hypothetical protein